MTIWLSWPRSSVYPSGAAFAASSLERFPFEPGRFSTTTGWPSASPSLGASTRAIVSVAPPGGLGTSRRTGRVGYCAEAAAASRAKRNAAAIRGSARSGTRFGFMPAAFFRTEPRLRTERISSGSADRYRVPTSRENTMKPLVQALVGLALSAASLAAAATVTESDMLGSPAQASAAQRTIVIDQKTRWITVERGEVVTFKANGRDFAWAFNGMGSSFDLNRIAPAGALDRALKVYIWPNAQDLADK